MNLLDAFNDTTAQSTFDAADVEKNKVIVMISYLFPILFFLPLVICGNSTFCRFHANQILSWLVVDIVIGIVMGILGIIPFIGWIFSLILSIVMLAATILLMLSAYAGKAVRIPVIGSLIQVF